ncbi:hypothetical protein GDO78_004984 [Eleutherodactylus coqui]|uniref:Mitoferrin-1 n=1 Tax=Eleutherodactylus coqui TaxID=57060 RepID=A0A8J6FLA4_ELECQ|nr:hypothetical protein GDO78_004984 [Eleutherodactylus coqui]
MELRSPGLSMEAREGVPALPGDGDDYESLPAGVSPLTHMTAGAVAGILEHTVMYPVDSVKTRMQSLQPDPNAQYRGVMEALRRMIRTEGLLTPLRGINVTMLGAGPAHALYFACYEKMKTTIGGLINHVGNSHVANVVKQRMQMYNSPYRSMLHCIRTIGRTEGVGAFYRSYTTQLFMNIPFQAIHFITYEFTQEQLNPQRQYHPGSHIASGAIAGAMAAAATTPLDVCKTLLNTQENMALSSVNVSGHLSGMANAIRTVYQLGGVAGYFKGVQARVIYQMPSTAIAWSVYEFFKYFLSKNYN